MRPFSRHMIIAAAAVFLTLSGAGPSGAAEEKAPPKSAITSLQDVVATVNGEKITEGRLRAAVNKLMPMMSFHKSVSDRRYMAIRKNALKEIIDNRLIYKFARDKNEDSVSEKTYAKRIKDIEKGLPKGRSLKEVLKQNNITMEALKREIRRGVVVDRMIKKKTGEFKKLADHTVTDEYMLKYYKKHLKKFVQPESIHLRGILLKVDPTARQKVWNDTRKKILSLAEEARNGADFAELSKKYSQDPNAYNGGDMGWSHRGSLLKQVNEVISKLKVGEISAPVSTIYGYHIFKLEGRRPAKQKKFSELNKAKLKTELEEKEFRELWEKWLKGLRDSAEIVYLRKF